MWFFEGNEEKEENNKIQTIRKVFQDQILYIINDDSNTAILIEAYSIPKDFTIPQYIKEGKYHFFFGKKYYVIKIEENSFNSVKSIRFPEDSHIIMISKKAFNQSEIESINFPRSLQYLSDGWCKNTNKLINIEIDPKNDFYLMQNDILISKKQWYDSNNVKLLFAKRNIKEAVIPSDVKFICQYAFEDCEELETVDFLFSSGVSSIGKCAFKNCRSLKKFSLPSKIEIIEKETFSYCFSFSFGNSFEFKFDHFSSLKLIGKGAFMDSLITSFTLPKSVVKIDEYAFYNCCYLIRFTIRDNCKLKTIGRKAFCNTSIYHLNLPNNFIKFDNGWCELMPNLDLIYVNDNFTNFNDLIIGKSDEKSDVFDTIVLALRNIKKVIIPSFVRFISPFAFQFCKKIEQFEIQSNSELITIGEDAFSFSTIERFVLPCKVTKIGNHAFNSCEKLKRFEIENNSQLQVIEDDAFNHSSIVYFNFPSKLTEIGNSIFIRCVLLQIIEIDENINLKTLYLTKIIDNENTMIMIPVNLNNIIH